MLYIAGCVNQKKPNYFRLFFHICKHTFSIHVQYDQRYHSRTVVPENNVKELSDVTTDCIFQQCVLQFGPRPCIANGTMESTVLPAPR